MSDAQHADGGNSGPGLGIQPDDPVLAKRARIAHLAKLGKRIGYSLFAFAMVAFFVGLFGQVFSTALVNAIVAAMVVGSILLVPAIVFAYGVRAAERADREAAGEIPARRAH